MRLITLKIGCLCLFLSFLMFCFSFLTNATNTPFANEDQIQIQSGSNASSYPKSSIFYNQMKEMQRMQDEMKNDVKEMLNDNKIQKPFINKNMFANFQQTANNFPQVKYSTDKNNYIAEFIMPGVDKKDIKIKLNGNILTVSTTKNNSSQLSSQQIQNISNQSKDFSQSITIPNGVDTLKINSEYKNGILIINLPKLQNQLSDSREITVN